MDSKMQKIISFPTEQSISQMTTDTLFRTQQCHLLALTNLYQKC